MKTKYLLGLAVLGFVAAAAVTPAHAGLSFHISIGVPLPPPPVYYVPAPCPPPAPVFYVPPPRVVCAPPPVVVYLPQPVCAPVFVPPGHAKRQHGHPGRAWGYYSHR